MSEEKLPLLSEPFQLSPYSIPPPSSSSSSSSPAISSSHPSIPLLHLSASSTYVNPPPEVPITAIPKSPLEESASYNNIIGSSKLSKKQQSHDGRPSREVRNTVRFPHNHKNARYVVVCNNSSFHSFLQFSSLNVCFQTKKDCDIKDFVNNHLFKGELKLRKRPQV